MILLTHCIDTCPERFIKNVNKGAATEYRIPHNRPDTTDSIYELVLLGIIVFCIAVICVSPRYNTFPIIANQ